MLVRFDPFRELQNRPGMLARGTERLPLAMPMDAYREGDRIVVHFDLPGVDRDAIDLTVERNELTVRATRVWEPTEGQEPIVSERPQGTFSRTLILGDNLDTEHVSASYDMGVLTLMVPVAAQAKPRRIEVQSSRVIDVDAEQQDEASPATTG